jgi:hypothetical protein
VRLNHPRTVFGWKIWKSMFLHVLSEMNGKWAAALHFSTHYTMPVNKNRSQKITLTLQVCATQSRVWHKDSVIVLLAYTMPLWRPMRYQALWISITRPIVPLSTDCNILEVLRIIRDAVHHGRKMQSKTAMTSYLYDVRHQLGCDFMLTYMQDH